MLPNPIRLSPQADLSSELSASRLGKSKDARLDSKHGREHTAQDQSRTKFDDALDRDSPGSQSKTKSRERSNETPPHDNQPTADPKSQTGDRSDIDHLPNSQSTDPSNDPSLVWAMTPAIWQYAEASTEELGEFSLEGDLSATNQESEFFFSDLDLPATGASTQNLSGRFSELESVIGNSLTDFGVPNGLHSGDGGESSSVTDSTINIAALEIGSGETGNREMSQGGNESWGPDSLTQTRQVDQLRSNPIVSSLNDPYSTATQRVSETLIQEFRVVESVSGSKEVILQLHPAELGKLTLQVGWENDVLTAKIVASELATSEMLNRDKAWLTNILQENGLELASFDVSHGTSDQQHGFGDDAPSSSTPNRNSDLESNLSGPRHAGDHRPDGTGNVVNVVV